MHAVDDYINWNALMCAYKYGHRVVAAMLLDIGINLEARDVDGWTALHLAAYYDHPDTCLLLLSVATNGQSNVFFVQACVSRVTLR